MISRKCIPLLLAALLSVVFPAAAAAGPSDPIVTGTVIDSQGLPVVGATVMAKNNIPPGGTVTDQDGRFTISMPSGTILTISCIGFVSAERKIEGSLDWIVTLEEDVRMLEDVVVVGYGVQKKESVVGAISQVGSEALVNSGTTNITNSLAGKLSGVQTFQTSGQPGADNAVIQIRGLSSWNGSSPLIMVDGVERQFSDLDPNEVQTISVLKDASATAVFGAKGANGVILVTTKSGQKGAPKMKLSVEYGMSTPTFIPQHISSDTIVSLANVAFQNEQSFGSMFSNEEIAA
ncbi:MAG: TonB-dependent receptor plug domain-containing protein, partial [Candidatus Cryptobacteroides sp.]